MTSPSVRHFARESSFVSNFERRVVLKSTLWLFQVRNLESLDDLLSDLPLIGEKEEVVGAASADRSGSLSIDECFDLFETPEKLSPEDSWYCPRCKNHVEATKTLQLWSAPPVLVLHLKRFSYSRRFATSRTKLDTMVSFPTQGLDLSKYLSAPPNLRFPDRPDSTSEDCIYDCVAVSNHMGNLGSGHYTASGKSCVDGKWFV